MYTRTALWAGDLDGGIDAVTATGGEPGSNTGGATGTGGVLGSTGGSKGTGGTGAGSAASGGIGSTGASGGAPLGTGGVGTGGRVAGTGGGVVGTGGDGTGGSMGTGGAVIGTGGAGVGTGGAGTGGAVASDSAAYNFETSVQSWKMASGSGAFTTIERSTDQHCAGGASLAGLVTAAASGTTYILEVAPPTPAIAPGTLVTFHVFVPTGAMLGFIQPYVLETGSFRFTGTKVATAGLVRDAWTTVKVTVPANAAAILRLGVQFASTGVWTDTVYVDSISW